METLLYLHTAAMMVFTEKSKNCLRSAIVLDFPTSKNLRYFFPRQMFENPFVKNWLRPDVD